jgi:hypothetical protein
MIPSLQGVISMRRILFCGLSVLAVCALFSTVAAGSPNPAEYPLRVHIFAHNGVSHYYWRSLNTVDGEGRANLYENGEPKGLDFRYHCDNRLMNSAGFETYVAKWKKPGVELQILQTAGGGKCDLRVDVKPNVVYVRHQGSLNEEPAVRFKEWMVKHQYDPEHGKELPEMPVPAAKAGEKAPQ